MTPIIDEIATLWNSHEKQPFPAGHRTKTVEGVNLGLLDPELAGYIIGFLTTKGGLGSRQKNVMAEYSEKLNLIIEQLETEEAKRYFQSLKKITDLVLEHAHDQPQ